MRNDWMKYFVGSKESLLSSKTKKTKRRRKHFYLHTTQTISTVTGLIGAATSIVFIIIEVMIDYIMYAINYEIVSLFQFCTTGLLNDMENVVASQCSHNQHACYSIVIPTTVVSFAALFKKS